MAFESFAEEAFDAVLADSGGETFNVGSLTGIAGIRSQLKEIDPLQGILRKTLITVRKSALPASWPKKGMEVSQGSSHWKIIDIVPGDTEGMVIIECSSTVQNPS